MAKVIEIAARLTNGKGGIVRELKCPTRMPETMEEAVKMFGAECVLGLFVDAFTVAKQANMRLKMAKEGDDRMTDKAILESMSEWKPGQRKAVDPAKKAEKIRADFAKLDPALRKEILSMLKG